MSVKYMLDQIGNKMGLDPSVTNQRSAMLRLLNEAAPELYNQADMVGSLEECLFKINGDQTVAFPVYVGDLRAARPYDTQVPIHINQMRPRYNVVNWPDMWRNYRIKNKHPLHSSVRNESTVTVTVHAVENPPVEVTITGATEFSTNVSETLVMDATSKETSGIFVDISSFSKNRINNYNVTLSDADGEELAVIPNNQLESRYLWIDVSIFPWSNNDGGSPQAQWIEVLYKKRLTILSTDSDEFPAPGYDDVLVNKVLQLWSEEQGKTDQALMYDAKATRTLARIHENENRATEDVVAMVPNPADTLLQRVQSRTSGFFPAVRSI